MQVLHINFIKPVSLLRRIAYLFLLASIFGIAYTSKVYFFQYRELKALEKSWSELKKIEYKKSMQHPLEKVDNEQLKAELKAANNIILGLSLPWDDLFREIESTMNDQVSLLNIEPDIGKKELRITAEAKNFDGVLAYNKKLYLVPLLQDVYVLNHQIQLQDPQKPVRFVIVAKWLTTQENIKN